MYPAKRQDTTTNQRYQHHIGPTCCYAFRQAQPSYMDPFNIEKAYDPFRTGARPPKYMHLDHLSKMLDGMSRLSYHHQIQHGEPGILQVDCTHGRDHETQRFVPLSSKMLTFGSSLGQEMDDLWAYVPVLVPCYTGPLPLKHVNGLMKLTSFAERT